MTTAYCYSRFSTPAQAAGDSLRRQLSAARHFAQEQGLLLDTSLRDCGVSAYHGKNRISGALANFVRGIEEGVVERGSYLLIDSFDRLSRESVTTAVNLFTSILLKGVRIVTLCDKRVYDHQSDMMEVMYAVMQAARSHEESVEKGRKVREAHGEAKRRAREEGLIWHKQGPTWLRYEDTHWTFVGEKVEIVQRIFAELDAGIGPFEIAKRFNSEQVPVQRNAINWTAQIITKIARSASVIGRYQPYLCSGGRRVEPDGPPIEGYYPPIIEADQFARVQARVVGRNHESRFGSGEPVFHNIFRGLIICGECGAVGGYFNRSKGWPFLRCQTAARHGRCSNTQRYCYLDVEHLIGVHLSGLRRRLGRPRPIRDLVGKWRCDRVVLLRRQANLLALAEAGVQSAVERVSVLQSQIMSLERKIADGPNEESSREEGADFRRKLSFLVDQLPVPTSERPSQLFELRSRAHASMAGVIVKIALSPAGGFQVVMEDERHGRIFGPDELSEIHSRRLSEDHRRRIAIAKGLLS